MATYKAFWLLFSAGAPGPDTWCILSAFVLAGALAQCLVMWRVRGLGCWLLPALLALVWIVMDFTMTQPTQFGKVEVVSCVIPLFLGTLLGTGLFYLIEAVRARKKKSPSDS